jgi:hypothetical protein
LVGKFGHNSINHIKIKIEAAAEKTLESGVRHTTDLVLIKTILHTQKQTPF